MFHVLVLFALCCMFLLGDTTGALPAAAGSSGKANQTTKRLVRRVAKASTTRKAGATTKEPTHLADAKQMVQTRDTHTTSKADRELHVRQGARPTTNGAHHPHGMNAKVESRASKDLVPSRKRLMKKVVRETTSKKSQHPHHANAMQDPGDTVLSRVEIDEQGQLKKRSLEAATPMHAVEVAVGGAALAEQSDQSDDEEADSDLDELEAMTIAASLDQSLTKKKSPRRRAPYPINCRWKHWRSEGDCSRSCGGGKIMQKRIKEPAQFGGAKCDGSDTQYVSCKTDTCPTTPTTTQMSTTTTAKATRMMGNSVLASFWIVKIGMDTCAALILNRN